MCFFLTFRQFVDVFVNCRNKSRSQPILDSWAKNTFSKIPIIPLDYTSRNTALHV